MVCKRVTTSFYSKQMFTIESLRRDVTLSSDSTMFLPFMKSMDVTGLDLGIIETCKETQYNSCFSEKQTV